MKSGIVKMQERHIQNLEAVLTRAKTAHQMLRNRIETVEIDCNSY